MNIKNAKKYVIALLVVLAAAVVIEILYFNRHAVFEKSYSIEYFAGGDDSRFLKADETEDFVIYNIELEGGFAGKFYMNYHSYADFAYTLSVIRYENGAGQGMEKDEIEVAAITDTALAKLNQAVTIVNQRPDKIVLKIHREDLIDIGQFSLSSIVVTNKIHLNFYRLIFLILVQVAGCGILFLKCTVSKRLDLIYFFTAMSMGTLIIILAPNGLSSWDEQIHFAHAYDTSFYKNAEYTKSMQELAALQVPNVNTAEERRMMAAYLQAQNQETAVVKENEIEFTNYRRRAYLLQAFGLKLGRMLGVPFIQNIWLGKFFNLLLYSLIFSAAIRYTRIGKRALACVGLLPTSIFLASSFSYDAFVTAFLMLGLVLIVNEFIDERSELNWKRIAAGTAAMLLGSFSKAVYIPMLLLLCFLPKKKFKCRKQHVFFVLAIVLVFLIMMSSIAMPTLVNAVGNIDAGGDARGGDTSVTRQIMYIVGAPIVYARLLFNSMIDSAGGYFLGPSGRTFFAYLGIHSGNLYYLNVLLTIFVTLTGENKVELDKKVKAVMGILVFGVAVLIWTALYLSFTPVGAGTINGVQQRYYIPLMFPVMLLFVSSKIKCEITELWYDRGIMLANLVVLSGCIYQLILLPYCS